VIVFLRGSAIGYYRFYVIRQSAEMGYERWIGPPRRVDVSPLAEGANNRRQSRKD
jgi:hypothetical protein